jgi:capsular polysaccharide biosynthesis protein
LAGKIIGTPQYMAPEQIDHPSEVDHRADIYALGVVFCQMLTGELPGKEMQAPSRKVSIDVRLDEMVLRALEEKPDRRYQTALEFRTVLDGLPSAMPPPTVPERGMFRRWWWMFLVMIPLGMLLGLAAAGVVAYVMPKKYEAEATIEVVSPGGAAMTPSFLGTQFEAIKSRAALSAVAQQLELSNKWMLSEQDVIRVLKGIVKIQNIRGTDLISIRVRHTNKEDVVSIVNAIVMSYQRNFGGKVIIHETPQLPRVPVSPNVTLLLVTGVAVGLLLSPLLALLLILVLHRLFPEKRESVSADKGGSAGKLATALLLLAGFLIVVVSGPIFWWREMRSSEEAFRRLGVDGLRPQMPIRTTDTPPPAIVLDDKQRNQVKELAGSPTFGPVIERVVTDIQQYPAQASLGLGSGDFITTGYLTSRLQDLADRYRVPPWAAVNGSDGNLYRWIKDSGADLVGCTGLWDEPQFKLFGEEPKYMLGDDTFAQRGTQTFRQSRCRR